MSESWRKPWSWDGKFPAQIKDADGYILCDMYPRAALDNANLVSAAPDLLNAALLAVSVLGHMAEILGDVEQEPGTVIPQLRAAIAKAKGEPK